MHIDIRKYIFWIVLGVVIVGYVVFYFFSINPVITRNTKLGRELIGGGAGSRTKEALLLNYRKEFLNETLPNKDLIDYLKLQKKNEEDVYNECLGYYSSIDEYLDGETSQLTPSDKLYDFQAVYGDRIKSILKNYSQPDKKGMRVKLSQAGGFGGPIFPGGGQFGGGPDVTKIIQFVEEKDIINPEKRLEAQKKYWIIKEFLDILENSNVKFLNKLAFPDWKPDDNKVRFIWRDVLVDCEIEYENLPLLINGVLHGVKDKDGSGIYRQKLFTVISSFELMKDPDYKSKTIKITASSWEETDEQAKARYLKSNPGEELVPAISVKLKCAVLDFVQIKP